MQTILLVNMYQNPQSAAQVADGTSKSFKFLENFHLDKSLYVFTILGKDSIIPMTVQKLKRDI